MFKEIKYYYFSMFSCWNEKCYRIDKYVFKVKKGLVCLYAEIKILWNWLED
jgi:hypothetical protein